MPVQKGTSIAAVAKGAYVLEQAADAKLIIVATGSEMQLVMGAKEALGLPVTIVSMPCQVGPPRQLRRTVPPSVNSTQVN
eukprot:COSAG01_NODE_4089_length_5361_cov_2.720258_5_plen_80_part_00